MPISTDTYMKSSNSSLNRRNILGSIENFNQTSANKLFKAPYEVRADSEIELRQSLQIRRRSDKSSYSNLSAANLGKIRSNSRDAQIIEKRLSQEKLS